MRLTSLLFISALSSLNHISHAFPLKPQTPPRQPPVRRRVAYSVVAVDGGSPASPGSPPAPPMPDTITLIQTSDSIETVTVPASSTPPSIETVIATSIVSELEPAKTVDIFVTQDVTQTPSPATTSSYIVVNPMETPTSLSALPLKSQTFTSVPSVKCVTSLSASTLALSSPSTWPSTQTSSMPLASSYRSSEVAHAAEVKGPEAAASIPSSSQPPPPAVTTSSTLPTASTKTYDDGMWHTSYPSWNTTSTVLSSTSATAVGTGKAKNLWKKG